MRLLSCEKRVRVDFEEQLAMLAALGRAVASVCLFGNARHIFELMPKSGDILFEDFIFTSTHLRQLCACRAMLGLRLG